MGRELGPRERQLRELREREAEERERIQKEQLRTRQAEERDRVIKQQRKAPPPKPAKGKGGRKVVVKRSGRGR